MFTQLEIDPAELLHEEYQEVTDYRGYTKEIFLNYRFTECLVTGYNPKLRLAVLDALKAKIEQLEQNTPKLPTNYLEALQFLLESETQKQLLLEENTKMNTKIEHQEQKIEQDKPFVDFAQSISSSNTNLKMSEYAKVISKELGYGRNTLYKVLRDKKIYTTKNLPLQSYINKGYFVVVENVHNNVISLVVTITPLGQQKLLAYLKKNI
jgi:phage antirepressor YoqD-like protein